jgi:uncharacterized protein (TIGR00297 family)
VNAQPWLVSGVLGLGFGLAAYLRHALTLDGALAAAVVGALTFGRGGRRAAAALMAFFISSSALSRLGEARKRSLPLAQGKGAQRDAWQVVANGGVAALCLLIGRTHGFIGSLAAAGADTWATELGLLARGEPRLITTLRAVPPGTSGGVTPQGFIASIGGALVVGLAWSMQDGGAGAVRTAVIGGLVGSVADSLLGATLQAVYRCSACGATIEEASHDACGAPAGRARGHVWMTNDAVNALATLVGALAGEILSTRTPDAAGHVRGGN